MKANLRIRPLLIILTLLMGVMLAQASPVRAFFDSLLLQTTTAPNNTVSNEEITLYADNNDSHDAVWEKRYYYGLRSWGIRGAKSPESGSIWFDSFPGKSGEYEVVLSAILEHDGSAPLRLIHGDSELFSGKLPYRDGYRDCQKRGIASEFSLGVHSIQQGAKIGIWAQSVYECGEKGAYMLWDKLRFHAVD